MRVLKFLILAVFLTAFSFALPLSFEQRSPESFKALFSNGSVDVGSSRLTVDDVTLRFLGADARAQLTGIGDAAPSTYLRKGFVRTYRQFPKVAIHDLYPGVDAIFYGSGENLEYDLQLAPGFSASRILIAIEGARDLHIDSDGAVVARTALGEFRQLRPRVFQKGLEIDAKYVLRGTNEIAIELGKYDPQSALTIDPVIAYAKTFGGTGSSSANLVTTDPQGNIYLSGQTNAIDFPTTAGSVQANLTAPVLALSNGGKTIAPMRVGTVNTVGLIAATKDGSILYAATPNGILLSGDGGATWTKTAPLPATNSQGMPTVPTVNSIAIDAFDPATILVATNAGLFGSNSGGQSGWGARNTGLPVSPTGNVWVNDVFYDPSNPLIAYATSYQPSYLFKSVDAGNTWIRLEVTFAGEPPPPFDPYPPATATMGLDGHTIYAINMNGNVFKSTDAGATFVRLGQVPPGAAKLMQDPTNPATFYVLVRNYGIEKSVDGGMTFSLLKTPTPAQQFALDSSGAIYIAGLSTAAYVSSDGGATFTAIPGASNLSGPILSSAAGKAYIGTFANVTSFVMKLDPTGSNILYSTFLGGNFGDGISGLAVDAQGEAVIVGGTQSLTFPFTTPPPSTFSTSNAFGFVGKLSADGSRLLFLNPLGGSKPTGARAVAIDSSGALYVTGQTSSPDFPTTSGSAQPALPTTTCTRQPNNLFVFANTGTYAFVTKFTADGKSTVYSTFLAGACGSASTRIAVDPAGEAIVTGNTTSPDFPITPGAYQPTFPGAPDKPSPPNPINAGFVTKLSAAGDKIAASTFMGGGFTTSANALVLDATGNVYITGNTQGFANGATPGAYQTKFVDTCAPTFSIGPSPPYTGTSDAFALKLDPSLASAGFMTYLGGGCQDSGNSIALDSAGNVWLSGSSSSSNFPLKAPFQATYLANSPLGGFVSELSPDATQLLFSSFSETAALTWSQGAIYLAGARNVSALLEKLDVTTTPSVEIDSITPVVTFPPSQLSSGPLVGFAPGQLIQISGLHLGSSTKANAQLDATGRLPFTLSGTTVYFDSIPAALVSVQATSIECYVPFEVVSTSQVSVVSDGQRSNVVRTGIVSSSPQILSIINEDGTVNSADHPAKLGTVIVVYVTGLGQTSPPSADGLVSSAPLTSLIAPVSVFLPGMQVTPQYAGAAPGLIAGISQVNVFLPTNLNPGTGGATSIAIGAATAPVYITQ